MNQPIMRKDILYDKSIMTFCSFVSTFTFDTKPVLTLLTDYFILTRTATQVKDLNGLLLQLPMKTKLLQFILRSHECLLKLGSFFSLLRYFLQHLSAS